MKKDISIEYAHIYTNKKISEEQEHSLRILQSLKKEYGGKALSLVVMVDDYSFPDPSFDYVEFLEWLDGYGFPPDFTLRESQLISSCDEILSMISDKKLKENILDYTKSKKYPCSLFVATWYLIRLGYIKNKLFDDEFIAERLINILPSSFESFEDKAFEIIKATEFKDAVHHIENRYFEGRMIA